MVSDSTGPIVRVDGLTKRYPDGTLAVDGISFDVDGGETFGLLGPNGAGKTTVVRMLVTLLKATAGSASIAGCDITSDPAGVRRAIGYSAQEATVDELLTVHENLVFAARLHGHGRKVATDRAADLCRRLSLEGVAGRRAGSLSGGMRRRLDLAQALVHSPAVVFLDEPTTGLDPESRRELWGELQRLNAEGVTILLTTQYLEEADRLCSRVVIVHGGALVASGSPATLKADAGAQVVTITLPADSDASVATAISGPLRRIPGALEPMVASRALVVPFADLDDHLGDVAAVLDAAGVRAAGIQVGPPTLDDVFLRHVGTTTAPAEPALTDA